MTAKTFSRVLKDVQPLTRAKPIPKGPSLTIYSLAQKYGFGQGELEKALAVHNVLSMHIHSTQMHDERIVCAIFAVLCDSMGYVRLIHIYVFRLFEPIGNSPLKVG